MKDKHKGISVALPVGIVMFVLGLVVMLPFTSMPNVLRKFPGTGKVAVKVLPYGTKALLVVAGPSTPTAVRLGPFEISYKVLDMAGNIVHPDVDIKAASTIDDWHVVSSSEQVTLDVDVDEYYTSLPGGKYKLVVRLAPPIPDRGPDGFAGKSPVWSGEAIESTPVEFVSDRRGLHF